MRRLELPRQQIREHAAPWLEPEGQAEGRRRSSDSAIDRLDQRTRQLLGPELEQVGLESVRHESANG